MMGFKATFHRNEGQSCVKDGHGRKVHTIMKSINSVLNQDTAFPPNDTAHFSILIFSSSLPMICSELLKHVANKVELEMRVMTPNPYRFKDYPMLKQDEPVPALLLTYQNSPEVLFWYDLPELLLTTSGIASLSFIHIFVLDRKHPVPSAEPHFHHHFMNILSCAFYCPGLYTRLLHT